MKKRILALALAVAITMGLGNSALAEVLPESIPASPEISAQPEDSASPEVTGTPEETIIPEVTQAPQETTTPEVTQAPEETTTPEVTASPEATTAPVEDEGNEDSVQAPILVEPYALPGVENFVVTQAAPRAVSYTQVSGLQDVVGTTIDVFDYWLTNQGNSDQGNPTELWNRGINNGHVLLFGAGLNDTSNIASAVGGTASGNSTFNNNGNWNGWSGRGSGPINGIVSQLLGADGYPVLDLEGWATARNLTGRDRTESLAYLFDPGVTHDGKQSYTNVDGLLRVDGNGYYYYDSNGAFASLRDGMNDSEYRNGADGVSFKLYTSSGYPNTTGGVSAAGNSPNGQFFPFNTAQQVFGGGSINSTDADINHYFGVHMQSRFVQQYGGHTEENGDVVTYEFSGDDDVWIFIDDVLVADLGGIHDAVSVEIDFSTGVVKISSASTYKENNRPRTFATYTTTLKAQFEAAGKNIANFSGNTFADDTYHTLDFFYLERGNTDSNMNLKYNLVTVPESSVIKVDQTGTPVPGAEFELYTADENYVQKTKIASGSTDEHGQFILTDDEGYIVSLQEIWNEMDQAGLVYADGNRRRGNLILVEIEKPAGYRSAGDVQLYLTESNDHVLLLSGNQWETGAYAYVNSTISMDGTVEYNGGTAQLDRDKGTLFAVVLRRTTNVGQVDPSASDDWGLMTGNATDGWHTGAALPTGQEGVSALLEQLHLTGNSENYFVVQPDSSGAYKVTVSNLPGEILTYYYMLGDNEKRNTEYTVGFYYTTAPNVTAATGGNTWRVTNSNDWTRVFSANVHVPNIKNRVFVQKLAPDGMALEGATFALYGENYYTADGRVNTSAQALFEVTTRNLDKDSDGIQLSGAGVFPTPGKVLPNGIYYILETAAPVGYEVNSVVTKVIVDDTGVYADAGEEDDGVVVARGVGSIVKSMAQFASLGDIDASLNNIVAKFYTVPSDTTLNNGNGTFEGFDWRTVQEVQGTGEKQFVAANGVTYHPSYMYSESDGLKVYDEKSSQGMTPLGMHVEYSKQAGLEYTPEEEIQNALGEEKPVYWMTTDTGWSKLMMEQCYTHSSALSEQGYNVTNLTNPTLYDLTNLFSGTVVVQVTDPHTTSLTINKAVSGVNDADVVGQTYTFTVSKMNGDEVDTSYEGSVSVKVGGTTETQSFTQGVLAVNRTGVGSIAIQDLDDGTYRVEETGHGADEVNGTSWQGVAYTAGANVTVEAAYATATIDSDGAETAKAAMTATNRYADQQILTVTKTVGGNMGDTTKDFAFTMQVKNGAQFYTEGLTATKTGQTETTLTADDESQSYTFTLKHDQQIAIQIPYGYTVTVTETAVAGYTTTWRSYVTGTEEASKPQYGNVDDQKSVEMTQNYTVDYLNECDMTVPPSGVDAQNPGISVMMGVAAASAVLIFGCSFLVWRRRRRDWM